MKAHKQQKITLGVIIGISFAFTLIALFAVGNKVIFTNPDTPRLLNYQGKLTDSDGPVTGTVSITFSIYDAGGTPIWSETHGNVSVKDGLFNAILGGTTPIPDSVFSSGERYLGLTVNGEEIMPRQQIVSIIFALKAQDADTVGGKSASDFALAAHSHSASDITSGTFAEDRLPQNAIDSSEIEDNSITSDDVKNNTITEDDIADTFKARDSDKLDGYHYDSLPYAPQSGSSSYIQNQFSSEQPASFRIRGQGLIYSSDEPFFAQNTRTNAFGRIGFEGAGLVGVTDSPVFGGYSAIEAINQNATGVGVTALGQGLGGWHYAPQGAGVQANGKTYGLYASAENDSGVTYGIYSRVDSPSGYAGYFDGDVLVNGDLSATGSKPATIRTSQGWERVYAVESPEVEISISGTDHLSDGESQVRFGRLFSEIISDKIPVRVIVTPVGSWSGIYVVSANTEGFTVRSGAGNPNAAFNWMAIARRKGYEERLNNNVWNQKVEEVIREAAENQTRVEMQKKDILRIPKVLTFKTA